MIYPSRSPSLWDWQQLAAVFYKEPRPRVRERERGPYTDLFKVAPYTDLFKVAPYQSVAKQLLYRQIILVVIIRITSHKVICTDFKSPFRLERTDSSRSNLSLHVGWYQSSASDSRSKQTVGTTNCAKPWEVDFWMHWLVINSSRSISYPNKKGFTACKLAKKSVVCTTHNNICKSAIE